MTNPTEPDVMVLADRLSNSSWLDGEAGCSDSARTVVIWSELKSVITTLQSKLDAAEARVRELEKAAEKLICERDDARFALRKLREHIQSDCL